MSGVARLDFQRGVNFIRGTPLSLFGSRRKIPAAVEAVWGKESQLAKKATTAPADALLFLLRAPGEKIVRKSTH